MTSLTGHGKITWQAHSRGFVKNVGIGHVAIVGNLASGSITVIMCLMAAAVVTIIQRNMVVVTQDVSIQVVRSNIRRNGE